MGMPLLPAERMAAISGPWAEFATSLKNEYLAHDDDAKCLADHIDTTRSRDFLAMAQVLIAINSAPDRVQFHAATVEKWLQRVDPPPPAFKARVRGVMDKFRELVSSEEHSEIFIKHRLAPVEFVMVAFLIAEQKDASLPELAEFIAEFRNSVRKAHADVRSNNKVIKTCYDVIEGQRRGAGAFSENRKRKKRAEEEDEEEEDEDYRGTPVTKISKPANTRSRNVTNHSPTKKSSAAQSPAKSSAKTHHPPPTAQMQNTSITSPRPTTSSSVPSPAMSPRTQPVASTSKSKLDGIVKLRAHKLKQNLAQGVNAHPSNSGVNDSKPQPQASVAPQGISGGVNEFFAAQPPQTVSWTTILRRRSIRSLVSILIPLKPTAATS
ncbi:hypothetical protein FRC03_001339 [Tulasnella sp. 419]|nr:hypothetical protein FRC03_001339 [Tulasnella sp. 419]